MVPSQTNGSHVTSLCQACGLQNLKTSSQETNILTHLPLDKMAAILADDNFKCIFLYDNYRIPIQICSQ